MAAPLRPAPEVVGPADVSRSTPTPELAPRLAARVPRLTTPTFGRDELVAEVAKRLVGRRLVSLTGMGGSGKSRVATVVAQELSDNGGAVAFLAITEATSPERLYLDIAGALEAASGRDPLDALADRHELVVLDNLESMPGADEAVAVLVERTGLTILVTTRLPLGLLAEQELPVEPLELPAPDATARAIAAAPAVAMFVDRATAAARAAGRSFELAGKENEVARLCRLLDGLPLALELAAARVKLLGVDQLLATLPESLAVLTTSAADVPERHRALERTIEWSYQRLDDEARAMCDRLALFEGGFTLDALEAVCPDVPQVLDLVAAISDARLVTAVESRVEVRFAMLGTVRAFAHRRLAEHADLDVRRQHLARHLATRVETWSIEVDGPDGMLALGRFADGAADVEGAIVRALDHGDLPIALRLIRGTAELWVASGRLAIGRELVARLGRAPRRRPPLAGRGSARLPPHGLGRGRTLLRARARAGGRRGHALRATASCYLAGALAIAGDVDEATSHADRALALAEEHQLYPQIAIALAMRAITFGVRGQFEKEAACHLERLAVVRAHGDVTRIADTLNTLAEIALDEEDVDTAAAYAEEALTMAGTSRVTVARDAQITLARALVGRGDLAAAASPLEQALVLADRTGQRLAGAQCLRVGAAMAGALGRADDAVRLFAAAEATSPSPGGAADPVERDLAAALSAARTSVGEATAARAWTLGSVAPAVSVRALLKDVLAAAGSVVSGRPTGS